MENEMKYMLEKLENSPELQCNRCGQIFKGGHDCSYERMKELLEGNDGMSVREIKAQFVDLHRELLNEKRAKEELVKALSFYGNPFRYNFQDRDIPNDAGKTAREAIEKWGDGTNEKSR